MSHKDFLCLIKYHEKQFTSISVLILNVLDLKKKIEY